MSADLNSWTGVGRLGRDVENPSGNGPARFSIAVNRRAKQGEDWVDEASWIDIEYWHKSVLPYLRKGTRIGVRGELRQGVDPRRGGGHGHRRPGCVRIRRRPRHRPRVHVESGSAHGTTSTRHPAGSVSRTCAA